jgi:hypothetical protein
VLVHIAPEIAYLDSSASLREPKGVPEIAADPSGARAVDVGPLTSAAHGRQTAAEGGGVVELWFNAPTAPAASLSPRSAASPPCPGG